MSFLTTNNFNSINNSNNKGIVVFSGGSAANSLVDVFNTVRESKNCDLSYVIPISDNGGSTSEIIRVIGGPGIGDIRSRLVRLIPSTSDPSSSAIKALFNHRLPSSPDSARLEWLSIVEGRHDLWSSITSSKRELIRSFLNHLNLEIWKRARPSSTFNFAGASIGNLFLTGARLFSGSFESAIYLLSSICNVPPHTHVLPAINTNHSYHISASLTNGAIIVGQNSISHPSEPTSLTDIAFTDSREVEEHDNIEDANLPGSLPTLRKGYTAFSKDHEEDLPARIQRIWYINPYGQEIRPPANPKVVAALEDARAVVYSIGSLYTSLIPSLILRGVGTSLASSSIRHKILILNSSVDRETGPSSEPYTATDFVAAIAYAASTSRYPVPVEVQKPPEKHEYKAFVTHVIHLDGPRTPRVDREELARMGIESMRVYGTRQGNKLVYDERALLQAVEAVIGRREVGVSRRNTIEG